MCRLPLLLPLRAPRSTRGGARPLLLIGWLLGLLLGGPAGALEISLFFRAGTAAEPASTGAGDPHAIVEAAARIWEAAIGDDHTVEIAWTWAALGESLGVGLPGSSEPRPPLGFVNFSSDFLLLFDPTPLDHSEYGSFLERDDDLGGGPVNTTRRALALAEPARDATDFLSLAIHEIGHVLGFTNFMNRWKSEAEVDRDIDLTTPRPFVGSEIPITDTGGGHIDISGALMFPFLAEGTRVLPTAVDVLGIAQLNDYVDLELNPAASLPEPGLATLLAPAACLLAWRLRSHRCRRGAAASPR